MIMLQQAVALTKTAPNSQLEGHEDEDHDHGHDADAEDHDDDDDDQDHDHDDDDDDKTGCSTGSLWRADLFLLQTPCAPGITNGVR